MASSQYAAYHQQYWRQMAELGRWLDAAHGAVQRLERLNAAPYLGAPVGLRAISEFYALRQYAGGCPIGAAMEAEFDADGCPVCGVELGAGLPERRVRVVLRAVQSALRQQVRRLASSSVRDRLTGESSRAIEGLVRALSSGHIGAALLVLDDELLAEVEYALDPDSAPRGVLEQLQRLHPVVRDWEVDLAVETFRRLLLGAVEVAARRGEPRQVHLASPQQTRDDS